MSADSSSFSVEVHEREDLFPQVRPPLVDIPKTKSFRKHIRVSGSEKGRESANRALVIVL